MTWTEQQLLDQLREMRSRRGDTTSVEVKRAANGLPELADTVCAFANMPGGGTVVLGVDEAQGHFKVVGVNDVAKLEAGLVATARQSVSPSPYIETQTFRIQGRDVVVAHVSPLRIADRPAVVGAKAYLRQSDGDYVMQEHELRMVEVAKLHLDEQADYDLQPANGRDRDDLVPELVDLYVAEVQRRDRRLRDRDAEQILRATNVTTPSGEPTLAGLYALGDFPQGQYPALTVTAAVQLAGGEAGPRNRNLQDFTGPVPVLLEELMQWVELNVGTVRRYRPDGHMQEASELPLHAVRELLANALVHRDLGPNTLGVGKAIQVRITSRALMILSPGGLRGVSVAQLESQEHAQAAVNQRLYQIAKKLRLSDGAAVIEGEGGGLREVFNAARDYGLPRPQLTDTGVQFKALLWRLTEGAEAPVPAFRPQPNLPAHPLPKSSQPTRYEGRALEPLAAGKALSIHELADAAGLSIGQLRYALARPLQEGVVEMVGGQGQRGTVYRLA